jgi:16S rRNA (guanine527-N7)-methyltransferase
MNLADNLVVGLRDLALDLPPERVQSLLDYLALLAKWNKVYNLTAVREPEQMLSQHLLDSLAVLPYMRGRNILDIGSGGGLPGIPLAIALPEKRITLLDSNHKKAAFLQQACIELKLVNVSVVCERVESWQPPYKFEIVVSRAFSDLATFVKLAGHLCAPDGTMLAMKGVFPHKETVQLPANVAVEQVIPLKVPMLEAERHLVVMRVT